MSSPRKYVLLCIPKGDEHVLEHVDVTDCEDDRDLYEALHNCYFSRRRILIPWLSSHTLWRVDYTCFKLYATDRVDVGLGSLDSLPPDSRTDYVYNRSLPQRYEPMIPLPALKHFIEHPSRAPRKALHLERIPMKINGRLCWEGGEVIGWGLSCVDDPSLGAVLLGCGLFWGALFALLALSSE
ncbi:MAG: hypothetical protein M1820_010163 [Bogoriella megaspora]|nr:MAG: hypothetical protein M1820_010163 [Bogoriella megaspora]